MGFRYVSREDAQSAPGLRMVVVGGVPSPWGEAAKGLFHVKGVDWLAVRLAYDDPEMTRWIGGHSAPAAFLDDEEPVDSGRGIADLAERLAPAPTLLPETDREAILTMIDELAAREGLGWWRRNHTVHHALTTGEGFPKPVAQYLAAKYGYTPEIGAQAGEEVAETLSSLAARLRARADAGRWSYFGDGLTAADIYSAAFMALFAPLSLEVCEMNPQTRAAFSLTDERTAAALDPILLEHRDRVYRDHLALPLSL